jgi:hypothetical protein
MAVAWPLVIVWPIGMVLIWAALLYPLRFKIHEVQEEGMWTPLFSATAFLHRDYSEKYFWWEVLSLD